ncbi:MAG: hypothetical protein H6564_18570 [Lewinellaceae bacterium]|nr:hypothetical protein [Lewinellaceae bacterium]
MKTYLFIFLFLPLLAGCPKQQQSVPDVLYGAWVHSHEEDTPDVRVFRPHDYNFPPSRGREGFEIKAGGEFIHYGIAPTDGTLSRKGAWVMESGNIVKVTFAQGEPSAMAFEVVEASPALLKIKGL